MAAVIAVGVLVGYVVGVVLAIWPFAQGLSREYSSTEPDIAEWSLAFVLSLVWPVLLLGAGCVWLSRRVWGDRSADHAGEKVR